MSSEENLQLFENQPIRTAWDAETEEWFFSISQARVPHPTCGLVVGELPWFRI